MVKMKALLPLLLLSLFAQITLSQSQCGSHSSCGACAVDSECKWCPLNSRCFPISAGQDLCPGGGWAAFPGDCNETPPMPECGAYGTCMECGDSDHCRWCLSLGGCYPLDSGSCPGNEWAHVDLECPGETPEPTPAPTQYATPEPMQDVQGEGGLPCMPALLLPAVCLLLLASRKHI